jgi:hypothetical protein
MSGDAQHDYLASMLELIAQKQFLPSTMDATERERLETTLSHRAGGLMTQYEAERKAIADLAPSEKRRKEFDKQTENLAKALPNVTKGTLSAITAFQKGDAITGSAALMDICASLAPLVGGLAAAGGPPGMLVGAIFAMIGQILAFFAPKSESLTTQIEKLMRTLQAEGKEQEIRAVHTNITNYATALKRATRRVEKALEEPGLQVEIISQIIRDFNPIDGPTMTKFWEVTEWLQEGENQDQKRWPIVLAGVCQAYTDLLLTVITLMSLVSTDAMTKRFAEAEALPEPKKTEVRRILNQLLVIATTRLIEYGACSDAQLEYLRAILPAAQNRGMLWQVDKSPSGHLYAGTNIRKGKFKYLGGEQKRLAVTTARADLGTSSPTYHVLALEPWIDAGYTGYDRTYHGLVKAPYDSVTWTALADDTTSVHSLTDIWATPADADHKTDVYFYAAKGNEIHGHALDANNRARVVYTRGVKAKVTSVRVVHDPRSVEGDPDAATAGPGQGMVDFVAYGGLQSSGEIYADAAGKDGYVPAPWGPYGLGIDRRYLWVFKADGVACATHASIVRCLRGEIDKPRWMIHSVPEQILYTDAYRRDHRRLALASPVRGVVDLCACDDGTLVAAVEAKSVVQKSTPRSPSGAGGAMYWEPVDDNSLYGAVHQIDVKSATIGVDWTKLGNAAGARVQKLPVFCWSLLESLTASLGRLAAELEKA